MLHVQHTVNKVNICQHVYRQNKQEQQVKAETAVNLILGHWCVRSVMFALCVQECICKVCVASVVHSDVAEQIGHGLSIVDAADGLSQDHTDINSFDLGTLQLLYLVRHRVGHHHLEGRCSKVNLFQPSSITTGTLLPRVQTHFSS